jgi:hypothetical protein
MPGDHFARKGLSAVHAQSPRRESARSVLKGTRQNGHYKICHAAGLLS